MKRANYKKSEHFLALFSVAKLRVHALLMAIFMVLSIFMPVGSGASEVHAEGDKEITVGDNNLSVNIAINGNAPLDPDVVYEGDTLGIGLEFTIPESDLTSGTTYVYSLPNNVVYTGSSTEGNIVIPDTNPLSSEITSAGTYRISPEEGKVYFYVTDEQIYEYNTGTTVSGELSEDKVPMDIPIAFNCEAKATLNGAEGGVNYAIEGFSGNLVLMDNPAKLGMAIDKTMSNAPDANGYIDCTVVVSVPSDKKSSYSLVDVTDTFLAYDRRDILKFVDGSLSVKKVTGSGEEVISDYSLSAVSTQDVSDSVKNGVFQVTGLPKLYNGEQYVITYKLQSVLTTGDKIAFNEATATSSFTVDRGGNTETLTDTQTDRVDYGISMNIVSKDGNFDSENGCISYLLTFNGSHTNLNGRTLRDVIKFPATEGELSDITGRISLKSISATAADGSAASNASITESNFKSLFTLSETEGGITISSDDTNTYVIEYTYKPAVTNAASELEFANIGYVDEENYDVVSVGIGTGGYDPQTKSTSGKLTVDNDNDRIKIGWKIVVTNPFNNYGEDTNLSLKDSYTIDDFENGHYIDSELSLGSGITVTYLKADGTYGTFNEAKDSKGKVYGIKIAYDEIPYGESKEVTYSTYVDNADMPDYVEVAYINRAHLHYTVAGTELTDDDTAAWYYTKPKAVHKYVMTDKDNTKSKTKSPATLQYSDTNNTVYYGILISQQYDTETTYAYDKLPEGATFGEIYKVWPADKDGDVYYDALTGVVESSVETVNGKQNVTFSISPEAFKDSNYANTESGGNGILIIYSVIMPSEKPEGTGSDGVYSAFNQVTYKGKQSSATQKVQYEPDAPILTKDWLDDKDEEQTGSSIERSFRVVINPEKKDIDANKDTLSLNDIISMKLNSINSISLEKIHLYEYSETAADNKGENRDSDMTFTEETRTDVKNGIIQYLFNLNIPDESAYVLEYTYIVTRTNYSEDGKVFFDNHVTLTGGSKAGSTYSFKVSTSSATSSVKNPHVTLYKVDSDNYNIKLDGSKFKLEKFVENSGAYEWQEAISSFSVDKTGLAFVGIDNTTQETYDVDKNRVDINTKTVYKLTEIQAPGSYKMSNDSVYFVVGSGVTLSTLTNDSAVKSAVEALPAGSTVNYYVTNSKMNFGNEKDDTAPEEPQDQSSQEPEEPQGQSTPEPEEPQNTPEPEEPQGQSAPEPEDNTTVQNTPEPASPAPAPVEQTEPAESVEETTVTVKEEVPVETIEETPVETPVETTVEKTVETPVETPVETTVDTTPETTVETTGGSKTETTAVTTDKKEDVPAQTEASVTTNKTDAPSAEVTKENKTEIPLTTQNTVSTSDDFGLPIVIIIMFICAIFSGVIIAVKRKNTYR